MDVYSTGQGRVILVHGTGLAADVLAEKFGCKLTCVGKVYILDFWL